VALLLVVRLRFVIEGVAGNVPCHSCHACHACISISPCYLSHPPNSVHSPNLAAGTGPTPNASLQTQAATRTLLHLGPACCCAAVIGVNAATMHQMQLWAPSFAPRFVGGLAGGRPAISCFIFHFVLSSADKAIKSQIQKDLVVSPALPATMLLSMGKCA
jgi:hypothetical protein